MFKPTQKLRVIIDNVSIYTTAKQVRNGIGDFYSVNAATQKALLVLETTKRGSNGIAGRWDDHNVQIDVAVF